MKFKIGDKVRVIAKCLNCEYSVDCLLCSNKWEGTILFISEDNANEWEVQGLENGHSVRCHFKEEQLLLVETYKKNIKVYGICHFVDKYYGGKNA